MINVQFQNLNQANSEILKAFNSANSAKALEAYQPLSTRERKLQKLKALQILKQSSESGSLQDISLNTDALSIALTKAEGATLQAMLNLLSAKMIEQNKYIVRDETEQELIKAKIQRKIEERQDRKDKKDEQTSDEKSSKSEESPLDKLVESAIDYYHELKEDIIETYEKILSAFSLENLRNSLDEGLKLVKRYAYEVPIESFQEYVIEPLAEFRNKLKEEIISAARSTLITRSKKTFSPKEIKGMLQESLQESREQQLTRSVAKLNHSLEMHKSIKLAKRKFKNSEIKLALHGA